MQLGKYSTDAESALHYLCESAWGNDSFGNVEAPTGYVWKISNSWDEVKPENPEMASVLEEWFEQQGDVSDTPEFRKELVGHYLIQEDSNGLVHVKQYPNAASRDADYKALEDQFEAWDSQGDD